MNWEITFRKAAANDFDNGYDYYASKKARMGEDSANCGQDAIDVRKMNPIVHPIVYKDLPNHVHIVSVFHSSQNPSKWQSRVR